MDMTKLYELLVQQGGFALIAVLVFLAYRKDVKTTAEVLITVVKENTASNVEMCSLLRALHGRMDNDRPERAERRIWKEPT